MGAQRVSAVFLPIDQHYIEYMKGLPPKSLE